jgi:hypothetical protein
VQPTAFATVAASEPRLGPFSAALALTLLPVAAAVLQSLTEVCAAVGYRG